MRIQRGPVNGLIFLISLCATTGLFAQTTVPTGLVNIVSQSDNLCLGIRGGPSATQQTAVVEQETCNGKSNQNFTFTPVTGGYKIVAANSGLALQPSAGTSSAQKTVIEQWTYDSQAYQIWVVSPIANQYGYFTIKPSDLTQYCMDVSNMSTAPGAVIWLSYLDGNTNQNWRLVPAAVAPPPVQHSVTLNWNASTSPTASGYNVYRGTSSAGPYSLLGSTTGLSYTDEAVSAGGTYYYVTAATDANRDLSAYSNQAKATIPTP